MKNQNDLVRKISVLNRNFQKVIKLPFLTFFCPIMYADEDVPLCKGHIINQAFSNSSRIWTVQRQDVDNFYGSIFESEFTILNEEDNFSAFTALANKDLYQQIHPKILCDGEEIDTYVDDENVPPFFSQVNFEKDDFSTKINLKISPDKLLEKINCTFEVDAHIDITIPACATLIKAAHLSMFEILGYSYVNTKGSYYVGRKILGDFFESNRGNKKEIVKNNANLFFSTYLNMIRVVAQCNPPILGTITDNTIFLCKDPNESPWAYIVTIRTGNVVHFVVLPTFDSESNRRKFNNFLTNSREEIITKYCQLTDNQWNISKNDINLKWPKVSGDYFYQHQL